MSCMLATCSRLLLAVTRILNWSNFAPVAQPCNWLDPMQTSLWNCTFKDSLSRTQCSSRESGLQSKTASVNEPWGISLASLPQIELAQRLKSHLKPSKHPAKLRKDQLMTIRTGQSGFGKYLKKWASKIACCSLSSWAETLESIKDLCTPSP